MAVLLCGFEGHAQSGYQLVKKTTIGGEGGWDYLQVDAVNRRIYLSHGSQVEVLNVDTHERVGVISDQHGVHGIAVVPKAGRGVITNGRSNTATLFDLQTLKPIVELPTGKNPDALLYDPFSDRVYVFDHGDVTTTVIDVVAGKVVGTVQMGGTALEAGVSDEHGTIFVNLEDSHEIVSFSTKTLTVTNRWKLTPGEEPTGLAIDLKTNRLFSVCHNELLVVLDAGNGKIVAQLPIGKRVDGVIFDPVNKTIISSNGEGTMTVVQEVSANEYKVLETVKTQPGARTIALDTKTRHCFLSTAEFGETPAATTENPRPRPKVVPGSFMLLEFSKK
jgi:DNA-binding beta-propeller fold protein YncE